MENSYLCSKIDTTDVMYSSDDINFRIQPMTVEKLLCGLRDNHIEDFTVRKFVNELFVNRSASYVESVIIGLPLLPIVFDGSVTPWYVIDGVKRLAALLAFANNKYYHRQKAHRCTRWQLRFLLLFRTSVQCQRKHQNQVCHLLLY